MTSSDDDLHSLASGPGLSIAGDRSDDDMRSRCSQHSSAGDSEDEQPCVAADAAVATPRAQRSAAQDCHIQQLNKFRSWLRNKNAQDVDDGDGGSGAEAELFHVRAFSTYAGPEDERVTATTIRRVL